MSLHALIVPVTMRLMRCSHSCDLVHRTERLILDKQSVRLLLNCEEGRTAIYSTNFQRQRGELNPGRLDLLPQQVEPRDIAEPRIGRWWWKYGVRTGALWVLWVFEIHVMGSDLELSLIHI